MLSFTLGGTRLIANGINKMKRIHNFVEEILEFYIESSTKLAMSVMIENISVK